MNALRIRSMLRRHRRRLALVVAVLAAVAAVVVHHAPVMDAGMDHGAMDAMLVCLAVVPLLAVAAVVRRRGSWLRPTPAGRPVLFPPSRTWPASVQPRARAGLLLRSVVLRL